MRSRPGSAKSLTIMEELGNRPDMAGIYHQLGIIAQVTGRLDEAEAWFRKSLTIEEELGNLSLIAMTYGRLCMLAQDRQQPRQALAWIIKSVTLLSQLPDRGGQAPCSWPNLLASSACQSWRRSGSRSTASPCPRRYATS